MRCCGSPRFTPRTVPWHGIWFSGSFVTSFAENPVRAIPSRAEKQAFNYSLVQSSCSESPRFIPRTVPWHGIWFSGSFVTSFAENPVRAIPSRAERPVFEFFGSRNVMLSISENHSSHRWLTSYFVSSSWSPAFLQNSGDVNRFLSWITHLELDSDAPKYKILDLDQSLLALLVCCLTWYFCTLQVVARISLNVLEPTNNRKSQERAARTTYS